jgi:hypothetical protein
MEMQHGRRWLRSQTAAKIIFDIILKYQNKAFCCHRKGTGCAQQMNAVITEGLGAVMDKPCERAMPRDPVLFRQGLMGQCHLPFSKKERIGVISTLYFFRK